MTAERFRKEYLPLQDELYRVAFYLLESTPDAEDAVQDLYLRLWDAADALDGINSPKAYCIRLLRNICVDKIRRCRPDGEEKLPLQASDEALPDERLDGRQKLEAAIGRMSTLSESERTVLMMKAFDDLSYEQIQKRTGLSYLSLRVHLSNARRKIRKSIDKI